MTTTPPAAATFEKDFDALAVGERFETHARTIGEPDITSFATLTGDTHPQHTDAEWAARSRFGERIAHGLLVLSYAAGLVPLDPDRVVALRKVGDATFKQPVRSGDTVHVEGEVTRTRPLDDEHGLVECRWKVVNQSGKLVLRASVELVWRRDAAARAPDAPARERDADGAAREPDAAERDPAAAEGEPGATAREPDIAEAEPLLL
jgi:3-hydroxybutyryl-CoA dehydratase